MDCDCLFSRAPNFPAQELADGLLGNAHTVRQIGLSSDKLDRFRNEGVLWPIHTQVITRLWVPVNYPDQIPELVYGRGMSIGTTIAKRRKELGLSQTEVANAILASQSTIDRIEKDDFKRTPSVLPALAHFLGLDIASLDPKLAPMPTPLASSPTPAAKTRGFKPEIVPGSELVGAKDFPIYAAAAGGSGHLIVNFDPIEWAKRPAILDGVRGAYGLLVYGDSMSPAYRHGDMALIHPGLGPAADEDVVLYDHPPNGDAEAIIKHLVSWTEDEWRLEQYNPERKWTELRADWPTCHRVVGKYGRRR